VNVVISQSMYFPWVGFLEQLRVADVFVRYDDVQFSKGSFTNRVQIKTATGSRWMTIPLGGHKLGQRIDEVQAASERNWRDQHISQLAESYRGSAHGEDMLTVARQALDTASNNVGDIAYASMRALTRYFGLDHRVQWRNVAELGIGGASSNRVLDIVQALGGTRYVTGHGARNYLDHEAFEKAGIEVCYMYYNCLPYPQPHGLFTPYVSGLDLVASCGHAGRAFIEPQISPWREFSAGADQSKKGASQTVGQPGYRSTT